ncbi:MAG: PaaI family thioesterase [Pseudomonadota bacterium]|uniref:PaaI family thioesterase n=1 Tax=unclassified Phenylobacterium TaxID=2640670 RepID=UPI0006F2DA52|nr:MULTISPECIES: PaaI family thioesterase [unclassified Phenylobacterium]KRB46659.1 thioesterase [Phenylobacterium sp. Root700]MBT9470410.1 PaaI family thioesterase [Phenylobacterium sp.]
MDGGEEQTVGGWKHEIVKDGEWAGWTLYNSDPFEDHAGPFYFKLDDAGRPVCAMRAQKHHMNGGGFMHGGAIMTFADYCLFVIARDVLQDSRSVTATFNGEFVGAVAEGSLVECRGEVVKAGRSMVFVRGLITTGDEPVMNFSAVIKKTRPRDAS